MKLVRESLYESAGYSIEQLKKDYETYMETEIPEVSDDDKIEFFNQVVKLAFDNETITSTVELISFVSDKINAYL